MVSRTERLIMRDGARFRAGLIGQTRQRASLTVIIGGGSPCDTQRLEVPVGVSWITADAVTGAEREAFVILKFVAAKAARSASSHPGRIRCSRGVQAYR